MERIQGIYKTLLPVIIILFAVGVALSYYLVIQPLNEEITQKESAVNTTQATLDMLIADREEKESKQEKPWQVENANLLEEKLTELPVSAQIQQVLLQFEAAEKKSGATIKSFNFTKIIGENTTGPLDITINEGGTTEEGTISEEGTADGNIDATVKNADFQNLVELHMDILLDVEDYYEIRDFLQAIETSERKMTVLSTSFKGKDEVTKAEEIKAFSETEVNVSICAFFVTGYDDLKPYMPVFKAPKASGKTNPFPVLTDDVIKQLLEIRAEELREQELKAKEEEGETTTTDTEQDGVPPDDVLDEIIPGYVQDESNESLIK